MEIKKSVGVENGRTKKERQTSECGTLVKCNNSYDRVIMILVNRYHHHRFIILVSFPR